MTLSDNTTLVNTIKCIAKLTSMKFDSEEFQCDCKDRELRH